MVEIETTYQIETTHINMRGKEWTEYDNKQWVSLEDYEKLNKKIDDFITTFMSCKEQEE